MTSYKSDFDIESMPTDQAAHISKIKELQRERHELISQLRKEIKERYVRTCKIYKATTRQLRLFNEMENEHDLNEEFENFAKEGAEFGIDLPNLAKSKRKKKKYSILSHLPIASTSVHTLELGHRMCEFCYQVKVAVGEQKTDLVDLVGGKAKRRVGVCKHTVA